MWKVLIEVASSPYSHRPLPISTFCGQAGDDDDDDDDGADTVVRLNLFAKRIFGGIKCESKFLGHAVLLPTFSHTNTAILIRIKAIRKQPKKKSAIWPPSTLCGLPVAMPSKPPPIPPQALANFNLLRPMEFNFRGLFQILSETFYNATMTAAYKSTFPVWFGLCFTLQSALDEDFPKSTWPQAGRAAGCRSLSIRKAFNFHIFFCPPIDRLLVVGKPQKPIEGSAARGAEL